jgi:hypothetical protein
MAQDWDIRSRDSACQACGAAFEDAQVYFSCLRFTEAGYVRADYCNACWTGKPKQDGTYSIWQGLYRNPPEKTADPLRRETAETLLRRLVEEANPAHTGVIYILAVMLERKRLLEEKDVRLVDGITVRVYEHRKSGETFVINDPGLRLDHLGEVQAAVVRMLDGEAAPQAPAAPG